MTEQELVFGILVKEAMARKLAGHAAAPYSGPKGKPLAGGKGMMGDAPQGKLSKLREMLRGPAARKAMFRAGQYGRKAAKVGGGLLAAGAAYKGAKALASRMRRKPPTRMERVKGALRGAGAKLRSMLRRR